MNINELRDKAYQCAVAHGWHDNDYTDEHWLCLVISELMEAVEADRRGRFVSNKDYEKMKKYFKKETVEWRWIENFESGIKDTVQDELADACIRLLDFAGVKSLNFDYLNIESVSTEDYTALPFTESMFGIIKKIAAYNCIGCLPLILAEIFAFSRSRGIDIEWYILQKMEYNRHRPYKHGNKIY